jgi:DNA mismatch repair protein MutS
VARLAGMPRDIVDRANDILAELERNNAKNGSSVNVENIKSSGQGSVQGGMQLNFFQLDDPVLCQIRDEILNLDVNNLTPLEALNKLNDIKKIVKGK